MPKGKGKEKAPKENKEEISAVDRTFYEITIKDLNNKLSNLRAHNAKIEERSEEVEAKLKQLEEDRADVTAFLDRSLQVKITNIKDLEEKLSELAKVRSVETTEFLRQIKEGELKYKTMQDELTSEIKLLTGKLNSLEEFRIQKDELLAKFDQQETELRIQTKQHHDLIYEIERQQVVDKDRLKKEVENKLLQLSNEFAKSNEIRIAAHVQRLVRENIALNNELDRMMFSQRRLQNENKDLQHKDVDRRGATQTVLNENSTLVKTCDAQLEIIKKLTSEFELLREENRALMQAQSMKTAAEKREKAATWELKDFKHKVHLLEQHVHAIRTECASHQIVLKQQSAEHQRLSDILLKLKNTVKSAARGEQEHDDDPKFRDAQRANLLAELMSILLTVNDSPQIVSSFETISSVGDVYLRGDMGISPQYSMSGLLNLGRPLGKMQRHRHIADQNAQAAAAAEAASALEIASRTSVKTYESFPIIDLESGSALVLTESSKGEPQAGENEGVEDDAEDYGESSSEDGGQDAKEKDK